MAKIKCPDCHVEFAVPQNVTGAVVWCPECGCQIGPSDPKPPPDPVVFPKKPTDETLLDISDAVRKVRELSKAKKKRKK